ncbi:hypothetical protein HKD37_01G000660 [Glycine soja]
MLEGLKLAWEMEFDDVICLSDSFNGINLVKDGEGSCYRFSAALHQCTAKSLQRFFLGPQLLEDGCSQQHPCNKLVEEDIGDVVGCIAQETWNSAFRDASCVADAMGKQALSINMDYHVFELASDCISMLWELI